jgi:predicted nucleic acid-binding protein
MAVVVDASLAGAWILPDEHSEEAESLLGLILEGREELAVPDLWSYEMVNLLLAASRRGRIQPSGLHEALDLLQAIPCSYYDHQSRLARHRTAKLAGRFSLSAYDAAYLELADRLQSPLRSADRALVAAAGHLGLGRSES